MSLIEPRSAQYDVAQHDAPHYDPRTPGPPAWRHTLNLLNRKFVIFRKNLSLKFIILIKNVSLKFTIIVKFVIFLKLLSLKFKIFVKIWYFLYKTFFLEVSPYTLTPTTPPYDSAPYTLWIWLNVHF